VSQLGDRHGRTPRAKAFISLIASCQTLKATIKILNLKRRSENVVEAKRTWRSQTVIKGNKTKIPTGMKGD
jgi:hypothetical protein